VNVTILGLCFRGLFESRKDGKLEELCDYASKYFYYHLKFLVEALDNDFEPSKKFLADIGMKVVDLFYDSNMIDVWFMEKNLNWLKCDFLWQEDYIDSLLRLLKNSQVAKGYARDADKSKWVQAAISGNANKYSIFERVAARLASHWFSSTGITERNYLWISYGMVAKVRASLLRQRFG
jgi:hypothetical protein